MSKLPSQLNMAPGSRTNGAEVAPRVANNGAIIDVPRAIQPPPIMANAKPPRPLFLGINLNPRLRSTNTNRARFIPNSTEKTTMPVPWCPVPQNLDHSN